MHSLAWASHPYAYKPRGRPIVSPILRFQRIESMLMSNGRDPGSLRQCAGCGLQCGRASRCFRCSLIATNFDEEVARIRLDMNENNDYRATPQRMEEGNLITSDNNNMDNNNGVRAQQPIEIITHRAAMDTTANNIPSTNTFPDNFNRFRMGSLNWGVWGCFIFATVLLVPSHIYFKQYDYRGELLGIFFVLTLLFLVCFSVSMFHSKTREILLHRLHLEEDIRPYPSSQSPTRRQLQRRHLRMSSRRNRSSYPMRRVRSTPELQVAYNSRSSQRSARVGGGCNIPRVHVGRRSSRNSAIGSVHGGGNNLDPPPYHLAILLPSPPVDIYTRRCETPPPSYDLVIQ